VVAIVAGATVLTGRGDRPGAIGTSPMPGSSVAGAPAPPGPGNYLIKGTTVLSAIIPVKLTASQHTIWTFVWFSRQNNPQKSGTDRGLQVCIWTDGAGYDALSACGEVGLPIPRVPSTAVSMTAPQIASIQTTLVSDRQITSLTARLSNGGSVSGVSAWGRGFPGKVWLVAYPITDNAEIVLGDASGRDVGHLTAPDIAEFS